MVMSRNENAGHNHNTKIDNKSFEGVEEFKYLGATLSNRNSIHEEIKSRLKWGMLAVILCRIFCLPAPYPKAQRLGYTEL
jgi:hypothetical protein